MQRGTQGSEKQIGMQPSKDAQRSHDMRTGEAVGREAIENKSASLLSEYTKHRRVGTDGGGQGKPQSNPAAAEWGVP
jgi:hypothetical protein